MLGVVRIYSRKVKYLMSDCTEAMWKIKMVNILHKIIFNDVLLKSALKLLQAFRPGNVDLPDAAAIAATTAIDDPRFFGNVIPDYDFPDLADTAFAQKYIQFSYIIQHL